MFVLSEKQTLVSKSHIYLASEYLCSCRMYPACWGWGRYFCYGSFFLKKKFIYLFLITHRLSLVASRGYSLGEGFSSKRLLLLQSMGSGAQELSSCSSWAQLPRSLWDLPGPGIELESPAQAGGFLTIELPGKSLMWHFKISLKS